MLKFSLAASKCTQNEKDLLTKENVRELSVGHYCYFRPVDTKNRIFHDDQLLIKKKKMTCQCQDASLLQFYTNEICTLLCSLFLYVYGKNIVMHLDHTDTQRRDNSCQCRLAKINTQKKNPCCAMNCSTM